MATLRKPQKVSSACQRCRQRKLSVCTFGGSSFLVTMNQRNASVIRQNPCRGCILAEVECSPAYKERNIGPIKRKSFQG
ncbi:uncharacterized protein BDZ83DRAFT_626819 [Colletotrichum acutatum]|uniref:Zn(2)-C6 fungal-type domain-containing protein n=1 Tax=Glomerella acutata TaxID=27357 RepID=A0AAD8UKV3_GLOAC|nr:uncharacterized protein BDZ83DRAFT_626819 [Colletotrichum acutatum]KAK1723191.1 hypothetical protein BDZ83DRAFT_626819 [Colletotrichum acutatum]